MAPGRIGGNLNGLAWRARRALVATGRGSGSKSIDCGHMASNIIVMSYLHDYHHLQWWSPACRFLQQLDWWVQWPWFLEKKFKKAQDIKNNKQQYSKKIQTFTWSKALEVGACKETLSIVPMGEASCRLSGEWQTQEFIHKKLVGNYTHTHTFSSMSKGTHRVQN
jgi:hypothetical protein